MHQKCPDGIDVFIEVRLYANTSVPNLEMGIDEVLGVELPCTLAFGQKLILRRWGDMEKTIFLLSQLPNSFSS